MADSIRDNVLRGIVGAADAGRPHGKVTYGYRRIYHQRTRALLRQEPDTEIRAATAADGTVERVHARRDRSVDLRRGVRRYAADQDRGVVERTRCAVAGGCDVAARDHPQDVDEPRLHRQAGPARRGGRGRGLARLVDDEVYWASVRLLEDPSRTTTRAGRAVHLLSYIVLCGVCGGPLSCSQVSRHGWTGQVYSCLKKRCAAVKAEILDEYVQRVVVAWLSRPEVFEELSAGIGRRGGGPRPRRGTTPTRASWRTGASSPSTVR